MKWTIKSEYIFDVSKSHRSAIDLYDALSAISCVSLQNALSAESLGFIVGSQLRMPESLLARKMNLKAGQQAIVLNAPEGYLKELEPLPHKAKVSEKMEGIADWVQVFVNNKDELENVFPRVLKLLKQGSILWISFPKGTSKIQTDLARDKGWGIVQASDLKWIKLISVNETWSAFSLRLYKPGEARQTFR